MSDFINLQVKSGDTQLATANKATGIKNDTVVELVEVTWVGPQSPPNLLKSKLTVKGTKVQGGEFQSAMTLDACGGDWSKGTGFLTFST